jgi:hypothetical protein
MTQCMIEQQEPWPQGCFARNRELFAEMNQFYNDVMNSCPVNYAELFSIGHFEPPTRWQRIKFWFKRPYWDLKDRFRHWVEEWD